MHHFIKENLHVSPYLLLKQFLIDYLMNGMDFCFFRENGLFKRQKRMSIAVVFWPSKIPFCTLPLNNPSFIFQNKKRKIFRRILIGWQKGFSRIFFNQKGKVCHEKSQAV